MPPSSLRVAIVESLPYEVLWNGDGVYLDGIRRYLTGIGCDVTTFVTDIGHRGPRLSFRTRADRNLHRWRIRQAKIGRDDRFLSLSPELVASIVAVATRRLLGRIGITLPEPPHDQPSRRGRRWIAHALKEEKPDLVIFYLGAAALLDDFDQPWKSVALGGWLRSRWITAGSPVATPLNVIDQGLLQTMAHADQVAFNNEADIRFYEGQTGRSNAVLWGMSFPPQPPITPATIPSVLYVGAKTVPNREGLEWLVTHVWPSVRSAVPDAKLRLVGGMTAGFPNNPAQGIEVGGFVDDLAAEYGGAQLVVAPILSGTHGAKTKVTEALGYARPLVTTSVGIDRGAPHQLDDAVDVADTPNDFADAIIRLLRDDDLRRMRGERAGAIYREVFSNDVAYAPLKKLVEEIQGRIRD